MMRCRACGRDLPESEFCRTTEFISELLTRCRECREAGREPPVRPLHEVFELTALYAGLRSADDVDRGASAAEQCGPRDRIFTDLASAAAEQRRRDGSRRATGRGAAGPDRPGVGPGDLTVREQTPLFVLSQRLRQETRQPLLSRPRNPWPSLGLPQLSGLVDEISSGLLTWA